MQQKRLWLGVDMDEVVNNMIERLLEEYNYKYYDHLKLSDITDYDIQQFLKPECKNIFKEFCNFSFMIELDVAEGAVEVLTELSQNHDIYFVTAGYPDTMAARDQWLRKHFPFYTSDRLIACVHKQLLKLDVLVDDYEKNLLGGSYMGVLIDKPWNRNLPQETKKRLVRIEGVRDLPKAIEHYYQMDVMFT